MTTVPGSVAVMILATGCQITFGAGPFASAPRAKPSVRVGVVAVDEEAGPSVVAGLRRDPHVESVVAYDAAASLSPEERSICSSGPCGPRHPTVCAWARDAGVDYFVVANVSTHEHIKTAPSSSSFSSSSLLDIHRSSSAGRVTSYVALARMELEVSKTDTCSKDIHLSRRLERSTTLGPSQGGGPEQMRRELIAAIPAGLADVFPAQVLLGERGRARAASPELPKPDGAYAVFRDARYAGITRLESAGTRAQKMTALTCCFQPGAGDVLVQGQRPTLFELALSFSMSTLRWTGTTHAAAGVGFRARYGPLERGWQVGLTGDLLYTRDASVGLGTIEGGYHWRPSPAWTVALVGGAGGGTASTYAGEAARQPDARGVHATVGVITSWQPHRDVYLALDLGYVCSARYSAPAGADLQPAFELRGPLLRLAAGLR